MRKIERKTVGSLDDLSHQESVDTFVEFRAKERPSAKTVSTSLKERVIIIRRWEKSDHNKNLKETEITCGTSFTPNNVFTGALKL